MTVTYLDFEKPIQDLEKSIHDLTKNHSRDKGVDFTREIDNLKKKLDFVIETTYSHLTPWQITQVARHPNRPLFSDYVSALFTDFIEIAGDRLFRDDKAIVCGFGRMDGRKFMVIGEDKGKNTKDKIKRNFGMPQPDGYRKALRAMRLAEKFKLPILTFVDTAGAYPGIEGEERGQGEAIARNLFEMSAFKVPIISTVIGEGGSGGALAIAVADRVLMLENAIYSVISPESCASILWRDSSKAAKASEALRMTAGDLLKWSVIDEIIAEPLGGAHRNYELTMERTRSSIIKNLDEIRKLSPAKLVQKRYDRFRKLGVFEKIK